MPIARSLVDLLLQSFSVCEAWWWCVVRWVLTLEINLEGLFLNSFWPRPCANWKTPGFPLSPPFKSILFFFVSAIPKLFRRRLILIASHLVVSFFSSSIEASFLNYEHMQPTESARHNYGRSRAHTSSPRDRASLEAGPWLKVAGRSGMEMDADMVEGDEGDDVGDDVEGPRYN